MTPPIPPVLQVVIDAAMVWADANPNSQVDATVENVGGYPTGVFLTLTHKGRRGATRVRRPTTMNCARMDAETLPYTLDQLRQSLQMGFGAPHEGTALEFAWEHS